MTRGILLMAYGTPDTLDDVAAYYTHIRGGRTPSPESVEHLKERYRLVGGRTPLLDITRETAAKLEARLNVSTEIAPSGPPRGPNTGATTTSLLPLGEGEDEGVPSGGALEDALTLREVRPESVILRPKAEEPAPGRERIPRCAQDDRDFPAALPGPDYRVYVGMKHWHPYIGDVVPRMAADGVREALALALVPHYSRMSIGTYRKAVEDAVAALEAPISFRFVESWHAEGRFRQLVADRIRDTLTEWPPERRDGVVVLFSAHSLPERILTWDDPYPRELRASAAGIAALAGIHDWRFAYQSAGKTGEPWLGPDLCDAIATIAAEGKRDVLSVPFGFVADHLEVYYDIDHEAQACARELCVVLRRTASPNADDAFIHVLAAVVRAHG